MGKFHLIFNHLISTFLITVARVGPNATDHPLNSSTGFYMITGSTIKIM